jgi:hypothetical protein
MQGRPPTLGRMVTGFTGGRGGPCILNPVSPSTESTPITTAILRASRTNNRRRGPS